MAWSAEDTAELLFPGEPPLPFARLYYIWSLWRRGWSRPGSKGQACIGDPLFLLAFCPARPDIPDGRLVADESVANPVRSGRKQP